MQICQHSKFVHHVSDSIAPCFVPVMPSCQEMMQSSHCAMQSSPPEPLPLVYSLAPSTVAYFPPPPIAQQTDDRGYASAESSPLMQVRKSHGCHVNPCHVITMACDLPCTLTPSGQTAVVLWWRTPGLPLSLFCPPGPAPRVPKHAALFAGSMSMLGSDLVPATRSCSQRASPVGVATVY